MTKKLLLSAMMLVAAFVWGRATVPVLPKVADLRGIVPASHIDALKYPDSSELISEAPEGESKLYSRDCLSYLHLLGPMQYGETLNIPTHVVYGHDGSVYLENLFHHFTGAGWIKGAQNGEMLSITFPQVVYDEDYYGEQYLYYALALRMTADQTTFEICENQTVTFEINQDGVIMQEEPDIMIGICYLYNEDIDDQPQGSGNDESILKWFGVGSNEIVWTPFEEQVVTKPDQAIWQSYAMRYSETAKFVKLAVYDGSIYISGVGEDPDACIKGEISSEGGSVTFHTNQYMGLDSSGEYFTYMVAAAPEDIEDPSTGEIYHTIGPADVFTANYDPVTGIVIFIEDETGFAIVNGRDKVGGGSLYIEPNMRPQTDYVEGVPENPSINRYQPFTIVDGEGIINFNIPFWTVEGELIDPYDIYYNVYFDEMKQTLTPDKYIYLEQELTDVPFMFYDDWDIFCLGATHQIYLYDGPCDRVGIQSIVRSNNQEFRSDIVYTDGTTIPTRIEYIPVGESDAHVTDISYFDLQGRCIKVPASGLVIKRSTFSNGRVLTEKMFVK